MKHVNPHKLFMVLTVIVGPGPSVSLRAEPSTQPNPQAARRGLIINESADHFFVTRSVEDMTVDGLNRFIDLFADTQVSHVFLNPNYMRVNYRSKVWESFLDSRVPPADRRWIRNIRRLDEQGIDPYAVWIRRCRQHNISPWLSMRMNDGHYITDPGRASTFLLGHADYRRTPGGTFDFGIKEVRDYHMSLIREYLHRYDPDGLELDWMRGPHYFKPGREGQGCAILTEFTRQVRNLTNQEAAQRGHPIQLAARVPAVPEEARALGLDGVAWARAGLIDILIPTPFWLTADYDIPMDLWRNLIGPEAAEKTSLAAGMELHIRPYPGSAAIMNSQTNLETMRGFTAAMLDRGADRIYLFNHFDHDWSKEEYHALLNQAARLETVVDKPRRHIVTYADALTLTNTVRLPPGLPRTPLLPTVLNDAASARFPIYTGPPPSTGQVVLRAGMADSPDVTEARLSARVNTTECERLPDHDHPDAFGDSVRVTQFNVPRKAMQRGYNEIELSLTTGKKQKIVWIEMHIAP